jgi:hypothetical protein
MFFAPQGRQDSAQGFNPGKHPRKARGPERAGDVRLKVRTNNRVKVPIGQKHWSVRSRRQLRRRSVAEGNCVVERRGGEQPEANDQSINKTMMNSIRPDALASLRLKGEAKNGNRPGKGERPIPRPIPGKSSEQ